MNPLISVIVPVFKAEAYIERCARSLLEQTYDNVEFYFMNDCTPDNSVLILERIVKEYPNRFTNTHIVNFKENHGHAHARNVALKECHGEYVIQIDADDWVETNMLELLLNEAQKDDADITCCEYYMEYADYHKAMHVNKEDIGIKGLSEYKLKLDCSAHWNKLIRTSLIKDNNIYCVEGANNWVDVGQVVPLRFVARNISVVHKCLYHYNATNENSVSRKLTDRRLKDMMTTALHVAEFVNGKFGDKYKKQMEYLKFYSALGLIASRNDYNSWRKTFPESHKYIYYYPFSFVHKICFVLADKGISFPYEIAKRMKHS